MQIRRRLWKTLFSPETLKKIPNEAVEISVFFAQVLDLANRVNHGRRMFAAEASADLGKRGVRQRLAEIHRNLTGHGDRFRVVARFQFDHLQVVVVGDELLNDLDGNRLFLLSEDVLQNLLRERER